MSNAGTDGRMLRSTTEFRVRYAEVDQMKFVYYGRYLEFFEVARTDMLRLIGLPYSEVEKNGLFLPVLEAHVKYRHPAHYDEVLVVTSSMKGNPPVRLQIDYEVTNKETGVLIATGTTHHAFLNPETGAVTRAPKIFTDALDAYYAAAQV
ncbi:MAG TPA: thioesterase family protein [Bacteroidota bacterium]|nr:thioesterase family protein [Bacteroidota bacterium]